MPRSRPSWWIALGAVSFLSYFALLVYCDLWKPEPLGLLIEAGSAGSLLVDVEEGSPAARAGIRKGDEITVADGHPVATRTEWFAVCDNLRFDRPLVLEGRRDKAPVRFSVRVSPAPWTYWVSREAFELLLARAVQLITLAFGLLIVFRRPFDAVARLGAWLLCSCGVFSVVFPYRIADVWRHLQLFGAPLWLAAASTDVIPVVLLTFFLTFPTRRVRSTLLWAAVWTPGAIMAVIRLRFDLTSIYHRGVPPLPYDGMPWFWVVSLAYIGATAVATIVNYRALSDANERRRLRVLLLGFIGCAPAGPVLLSYWYSSEVGLFASPAVGLATLMLLTVPVSFAYAILRHRLFDIRVIVRQGVRYALARRLLLSLVPALLCVLALDLYNHRNESIAHVVVARAAVYVVLAGLALLAQFQRQSWLDALDRRFFREQYDAQRLLKRVAEDIRDSGSFAGAAARVVVQIELALHPRWVSILARTPTDRTYRPIASAPPGASADDLPLDGKLPALAAVLGKPLDVSSSGAAWVGGHLPVDEANRVVKCGLEVLVPIMAAPGRADALLALGPRRSDEPYARDDQDLLATIAANLAPVLASDAERGAHVTTFAECPRCGTCYDAATATCAEDGTEVAAVALPRVLVGRYRLDRRLERGGMGVVYAASDLGLERDVAVKVLREDLAGNTETAARFRLEARLSAGFTHPHVVTIYDFGVTDGSRAFLVMERLTGTTVRGELEQHGRFDASRVLAIVRAVGSAVDAAHRRGLVHRDLKPENIFLARADGNETPKVLDFGIAKVLSDARSRSDRETAAGVMLGTPQYMAPEQLSGDEANPSWDLWALAVVTHEMLTGRHPFASVAFAATADGLPRPHRAMIARGTRQFGQAFEQFFARALAIDPDHRPASAAVFANELEGMLRQG